MTSSTFSVTAGTASQLVFTTQPGGGANGAAWGTQPAVSVEDAGGNVVTNATNSITLAIGTNPGGTLACTTNPLDANTGMATFAGCKITGKAGTYTLTAAAAGLTGTTSNTFTITFGTATQIAFSTQPGGGANGAAFGTQPAVSVEDASGNVVTNATNSVTLAVGTNPGGALDLHHQPARGQHRHGLLRRLRDHRQGRHLHADRRGRRLHHRDQRHLHPSPSDPPPRSPSAPSPAAGPTVSPGAPSPP